MRKALLALVLVIAGAGLSACDPPISCDPSLGVTQCVVDNTGAITPNLEVWESDLYIISDGYEFTGIELHGCINVLADDVWIHDVIVRSDHPCGAPGAVIATGVNGDQQTGLVVEDTEIDGTGHTGDLMGIGQTEYTCQRCDIHNVDKGAKADRNVILADSYIHDLSGPSHQAGFFFNGGAGNIDVWHNWIVSNGPGAVTGAVDMINDQWAGSDVRVLNNYLEGQPGVDIVGGYAKCVNPPFTNINIQNNWLSPNTSYGIFAYGWDDSVAGNTWANNRRTDTQALVTASRGCAW